MKLLAIIGAVILVASHQIIAKPASSGSFSKDVANLTNAMLSLQENPNNLATLVTKAAGFVQASNLHNIDFQIYGSTYNILNKLVYLGSAMATSEQVMNKIGHMQDEFDGQFDDLNLQRDVDASLLPSKINTLIDDFISGHIETIVELLDNMHTQANKLLEETEKIAPNSIILLDSLVEKVEKCLNVPRTEFKEIFQCRQDVRTVLPHLAHDTSVIEAIKLDLDRLAWLKLDNKTSVRKLEWQIRKEKKALLRQIDEERYNREHQEA